MLTNRREWLKLALVAPWLGHATTGQIAGTNGFVKNFVIKNNVAVRGLYVGGFDRANGKSVTVRRGVYEEGTVAARQLAHEVTALLPARIHG